MLRKLHAIPEAAVAHSRPRIAVLLPAYNEEQTIAATIEGFRRALPQAAIWVINNRSADRTRERALAALEGVEDGGVLDEPRPGKGNAMRRGFMAVEADAYLVADADLTYPPEQAQLLLAPVLAGQADMAVGDRRSGGEYAAENRRALHGFGNELVCRLVNTLFRARLADIMSGYRAVSRRFAKTYPILVDGFEIETDMTLHALDKRFAIVEVPVRYQDRPAGSVSKLNTLGDGLRVLRTIANILRHYRPLAFFGSAALLAAGLGLLAGVPVLQEWLATRYITHVPLAILASALEISAMVLAAVGLILDSLAHQEKRHFERDLLHLRATGWADGR